jgi:hypothetical protein
VVVKERVILPAGRFPQAQVGPETSFSFWAFSQLQEPAACFPQEHLAFSALEKVSYWHQDHEEEGRYQTQPELDLPQHVDDGDILVNDNGGAE